MKLWRKFRAQHTGQKFIGIPVHAETKKRLDGIATKTDTYDSFVNRLLDMYEREETKK